MDLNKGVKRKLHKLLNKFSAYERYKKANKRTIGPLLTCTLVNAAFNWQEENSKHTKHIDWYSISELWENMVKIITTTQNTKSILKLQLKR